MLKIEASNEEATYILANLMLMKGQTEGAISTYMALLEKEPNNFNILANLIELMTFQRLKSTLTMQNKKHKDQKWQDCLFAKVFSVVIILNRKKHFVS